jgi:hypothetical protein
MKWPLCLYTYSSFDGRVLTPPENGVTLLSIVLVFDDVLARELQYSYFKISVEPFIFLLLSPLYIYIYIYIYIYTHTYTLVYKVLITILATVIKN